MINKELKKFLKEFSPKSELSELVEDSEREERIKACYLYIPSKRFSGITAQLRRFERDRKDPNHWTNIYKNE